MSEESPFLPASAPAAAGKTGPVLLSGITVIASKTYVCLTDTVAKKSRWMTVGSKADAFEVISCSPETNEAVVRINGESQTLRLKKSEVLKAPLVASAPANAAQGQANQGPGAAGHPNDLPPQGDFMPPPGPPPDGGAGGPPQETADELAAKIKQPETREEKEREARMFVTDMLDISMRQRKAYEEAQKKASEAAAKKQ